MSTGLVGSFVRVELRQSRGACSPHAGSCAAPARMRMPTRLVLKTYTEHTETQSTRRGRGEESGARQITAKQVRSEQRQFFLNPLSSLPLCAPCLCVLCVKHLDEDASASGAAQSLPRRWTGAPGFLRATARVTFAPLFVSLLALLTPVARAAPVSASEVVSYTPGDAREDFRNTSAALGLPAGDTTFGALTPFNPPFSNEHLVIVGAGGELTLRLASPVIPVAGPAPELGVFVNNGLIDVSPGGTGTAGSPASTFSPAPRARVSVSNDGATFVPLAGGGLVTFDNPTNFYTDTAIENYSAPLGQRPADFSKPFAGTLSNFDGLTYEQMVQLLDGSAGGTWLDVSGTGLSGVQFVRFEVPAGTDARLVLDAVTAVPEPGGLLLLLLPLAALRRRCR